VIASPILNLFLSNNVLKYSAFSYNFCTLSGSFSKISSALIAAPVLNALIGALKTAPWAWEA
jgi:hypothetical protein